MTEKHEPRICLGAFAGAHGVKGELRIKPFTETPENVAAYGPVTTEDGARTLTLKSLRPIKGGFLLAKADGIATRDEAEALKSVRFYVARSALPATEDDSYYVDDLIGLAAIDDKGAALGDISAVHNFGGGDILELKTGDDDKNSLLVPFTREAVPELDFDKRRVVIAAAALEEIVAGAEGEATISDETGEIVSDDIEVDLAAMREEDA